MINHIGGHKSTARKALHALRWRLDIGYLARLRRSAFSSDAQILLERHEPNKYRLHLLQAFTQPEQELRQTVRTWIRHALPPFAANVHSPA